MTFEEFWPTLALPAEYDDLDACDQERWRAVIRAAFYGGVASASKTIPKESLPPETGARCGNCVQFRGLSIGPTCLRHRMTVDAAHGYCGSWRSV